MAKFAYNNITIANSSYTLFELHFVYYPKVFYKKNFDLYFKPKIGDKLVAKLRNLIFVYKKNF